MGTFNQDNNIKLLEVERKEKNEKKNYVRLAINIKVDDVEDEEEEDGIYICRQMYVRKPFATNFRFFFPFVKRHLILDIYYYITSYNHLDIFHHYQMHNYLST